MKNKVIQGDCLEKLKELEDNSVDSIVTDPPYHLVSIVKRFGGENSRNTPSMNTKEGGVFARKAKGFMGKEWDGLGEDGIGIANNSLMWAECLRVLKPGGHLLAFSGTRTYHRMASAIEDAGFEVRDMIEWVYGSGFPKSLNIGKAVDKIQGNERANLTTTKGTSEYEGWGTALKPAHEPICMARKPLAEKTVAENCLKYGTGGINIDESRVDGKTEIHSNGKRSMYGGNSLLESKTHNDKTEVKDYGRFPANLIHDNSEEVRECFPETGKGNGKGVYNYAGREYDNKDTSMFNGDKPQAPSNFNDSGNASRFFKSIIYQAKASKSERNKGMDDLEAKPMYKADGSAQSLEIFGSTDGGREDRKNNHPTVKPIALMEYLIKMVTPKGGVVLDPFAGSGSTLVAAKQNGYQYIGIEMTEEYIPIIKARLNL